MSKFIDISDKITEKKENVVQFLPTVEKINICRKNIPKFVYDEKCLTEFQVFVKYLVQYFLVREYPENIDKHRCSDELLTVFNLEPNGAIQALLFLSKIDPNKKISVKFLTFFKKNLIDFFSPIISMKACVIFNFEIKVKNLKGYPDIIWAKGKDIGIINISIDDSDISEISALSGLFRERGLNVEYFGFYFPLIGKGFINSVPKDWNHLELLDLLSN